MRIHYFLILIGVIFPSILSIDAEAETTKFAGQPLNLDGTLFMRARMYDPETGVFLGKDPLGVYSSLNHYAYADSNPINKIDTNGKVAETVWDVINLGVGVTSLGYNLHEGNYGWAAVDTLGLAYDGFATAVPFLPAGASAGLKALRATGSATKALGVGSDVIKVANKTDELAKQLSVVNGGLAAAQQGKKLHTQIETLVGTPVLNLSSDSVSHFWGANKASGKMADLTWKGVPELWNDVTTIGQWGKHIDTYGAGGIGTIYQRGVGVTNILIDGSSYSAKGNTFMGAYALFGQAVAGVLIDKAATLIESNLADIKGATYDPVSKQIIFLGSNTTPGVDGIDMDYFYTAVNSVYGSAAPPSVSLDAPASAASLWQDFGDGDGVYEAGEWGGFSLRYNPLWSEQDTNIKVRIKCTVSGIAYDFGVNFAPQTVDWQQFPNGEYPMHLVAIDFFGTAPPGIGLWSTPFAELDYGATNPPNVNTGQTVNGGQDWTYPFQIQNDGMATMTNFSFAVIPDRQHRRFGGRLENTKLGWVLQEADRIMKCLATGKDNITGATYSSATLPISGYRNLAEINAAGTSVSGNTRVWFLAEEMALKRHSHAASGRATMVFDRSIVGVKTESALNFQPQSPGVAAFASHLQTNFDAFANRTFAVVSPDDPSGQTIINVKIFKMLKDAMQAVSLARFLRDNNIPLDTWWMNSWQAPVAYSALSVPTITNETLGIVLYGGVDNRKVNAYTPSTSAQSVGMTVATARPNAAENPTEDIKQQAWTASTTEGALKAVAASLKSSGAGQGTINLAETDLSFASPGALPLEFTRYYQSGYTGESDLGPGWRVGRYVLEFEKPSWFDENNMMRFGTQLVARDDKGDTRLRSGAVRLVDLASGATLDFNSTLTVNYYQTASGTPAVTLAGLSVEQLPVFNPGQRKDGTVLVQNDDGVLGYGAYLPDGSVLVFDPEGRLEITQDRHGYGQWYFRDGLARITSIQDSANRTLAFSYHPTTGKLVSVTGPQNERANYNYDVAGRLEGVTHQRSGAALARYTYNADDQLLDVKRMDGTTEVTSVPDIKGRSDERMDERDNSFDHTYTQNETTGTRTMQVQDEASSLGPSEQITDDKGRTTSVSDPLDNTTSLGYTGDSRSPNSVRLPTPNRPAITIQRNNKEQPTVITDPAVPGAEPIGISYNSANRVTQVTDEAGRAIEADYDTAQNLKTVRRFLGATPVEVDYGYLNGYLRTLTDPLNKTWTTNRDIYGRETSIVDPTGITLSMAYDSLGRLWRITDPRLSSPITYTFDSLDRILTITTPAGVTTYAYDPITKWLASIKDVQNRTVSFTHDPANGDITKSSYTMALSGGGTKTLETNYSFARFGDLETVAAPESTPVSFEVDDLGRNTGSNETDSGLYDAPRGFVSNNARDAVWTNIRNHIFTWGAPESASPVDGYSFARNANATETVTTTAPTSTWNAVGDGLHTARVRAKNTAGFWGPEAAFSLKVDGTVPTISNVAATPVPIPQSPGVVTLSATVSDQGSGLVPGHPQIRWCVSADASRNWNSYTSMVPTGGTNWNMPVSQNGAQAAGQVFYYEILANDLAGNSSVNNGSVAMTYTGGGGAGVPVMSPGWMAALAGTILLVAGRLLPKKRIAS